eukprot:5625114-Lingulodinium_polyedra.AAC.1
MYVITNADTHYYYSKTKSGTDDRDPNSGSARYVHIPTRPGHSKIRMYHAQKPGRGMDPGVTKT